ncbi:hypothetical protein C8R47DRAFT_445914 [Mycena vitilis]|nr:hypothetical protein C8R47DRAFT_445914 [Mycena vitilis]
MPMHIGGKRTPALILLFVLFFFSPSLSHYSGAVVALRRSASAVARTPAVARPSVGASTSPPEQYLCAHERTRLLPRYLSTLCAPGFNSDRWSTAPELACTAMQRVPRSRRITECPAERLRTRIQFCAPSRPFTLLLRRSHSLLIPRGPCRTPPVICSLSLSIAAQYDACQPLDLLDLLDSMR